MLYRLRSVLGLGWCNVFALRDNDELYILTLNAIDLGLLNLPNIGNRVARALVAEAERVSGLK